MFRHVDLACRYDFVPLTRLVVPCFSFIMHAMFNAAWRLFLSLLWSVSDHYNICNTACILFHAGRDVSLILSRKIILLFVVFFIYCSHFRDTPIPHAGIFVCSIGFF